MNKFSNSRKLFEIFNIEKEMFKVQRVEGDLDVSNKIK